MVDKIGSGGDVRSNYRYLAPLIPQQNKQETFSNPSYPEVDSWNSYRSRKYSNWTSLDDMPLEQSPNRKYAIVVIDVQKEFTRDNGTVQNRKVQNIKNLIQTNFQKIPISVVEYNFSLGSDTEPSLIEGLSGISYRENNLLNQANNFNFFRKRTDGAFDSTNLAQTLKAQGVTDIVLAGLNEEACVYETGLGALKNNFNIITSPDLTFNTFNNEPLSDFYSVAGHVLQKQTDLQTLLDQRLFIR